MASRHHHRDHGRCHRHNHRESIPISAAISSTPSCRCCSGDYRPCCTQSDHLPPTSLDHLLRLVAAYLEEQLQETQCGDQTHFCETRCRSFNGFKGQRFVHQQKNVQREYDHFVLSCLLRKIEDLEFSLNRFSSSSCHRRGSYFTVRDSAARVIQIHFRSYLVRRSRSLWQLKELAMIKSSFLSLKSSVSGKTHFPFEVVSREAMDLLTQLDFIQSRDDPMLRDGKKSLSRDLVRFLEYVDGCAVKRHEIILKHAKDTSFIASSSKCRSLRSRHLDFGSCEDKNSEKLRKRMEKIIISSKGNEDNNVELEEFHFVTDTGEDIPVVSVDNVKVGNLRSRNGVMVKGNVGLKPRVGRTIRFDKRGDAYPVYGSAHEPASNGEEDSVDDDEEILVMSHDNGVSHSSKTRKGVLVKGTGGKTRVVKTVSFDEKGNVYRVYGDTPESSSGGDDDNSTNGSNSENGEYGEENGYDEVEEIKCVPRENKVAEEEARSEDEESSSQGSQGEIPLTRNANHAVESEFRGRKGGLMFSPPLPLKMEP
ncbi:PREDICTED: BAG family molecular chaperone regulator 8, chloroplastic-like [Tarenaya hassleriana]|uniref:BAG family molecular chaperone regulator 8, chloroplastic-like n=1 Tax=Tarenaya hassleriana TaxID=28532 RepID=UPI00053C90C4|nr:PREDICTED: BAG family molecular chaperone regulator 8, chloroplastic-like [Tarenaya hassleriana]